MLEGQTFSFSCHMAHGSCSPWFIKKLPQKLEIREKSNVHMDCHVNGDLKKKTFTEKVTTTTTAEVAAVASAKSLPNVDEAITDHAEVSSKLIKHTHLTGNHANLKVVTMVIFANQNGVPPTSH